jgi:hypothetical protein
MSFEKQRRKAQGTSNSLKRDDKLNLSDKKATNESKAIIE